MLVLVGLVAGVIVTAWTAVRLFQGLNDSSGYEKLKVIDSLAHLDNS